MLGKEVPLEWFLLVVGAIPALERGIATWKPGKKDKGLPEAKQEIVLQAPACKCIGLNSPLPMCQTVTIG